MKDLVVTEENVHQVVQAMYENIKSNQHRIDAMEPVLTTMSRQVERLNTLLVDNGYAKAVKDSAGELKQLRSDFNEYLISREATCPTLKRLAEQRVADLNRKHWGATVFKVVAAGIGAVSTLIIIFEKIL